MLFNAAQFEQVFGENQLKRGLSLFLKGDVEPIVMQASEEMFFVVREAELSLKIRGEKVLSYSCSCKSDEFCSHLSAVLFYLQKDTFDSRLKLKTPSKIQQLEASFKKENQLTLRRKKEERDLLISFIAKQRRQVFVWELKPLLANNSPLTLFDLYLLLTKHLLEPYSKYPTLGKTQIEQIESTLNYFIQESEAKDKMSSCLLFLSVVLLFIELFQVRYSSDEKKLLELYDKVCEKLDQFFKSGLNTEQEECWHSALLTAVGSNKIIATKVFEFLLPRWVSQTKNKQKLWQLNQILNKRHLKLSYTKRFDKLLIARLMVYLRESQLFKSALPSMEGDDSVELIIAEAELNFHSGKIDKAFKILEAQYEDIKNDKTLYYQAYLEYLIQNSISYHKTDLELKYRRESFIHSLFILPEQLNRFLQLLPPDVRTSELNELVKRIKKNPFNYSFDKVVVLLWESKLWDELILEIKKHKNKFHLLHEVLIKKLPDYNQQNLSLYCKHLSASILEKEFYPYQLELLNKALIYLNKLPKETTEVFMNELLNGLLKQSQIYRYLKEENNLE